MDILLLLTGIAIGAFAGYLIFEARLKADREAFRAKLIQENEAKIRDLEKHQHAAIKKARKESTNQSRAVLKGKLAEQIAPLLPGFVYWPADARFLGDPVDYVVFNGYSEVKDNAKDGEKLEVVILDIKKGRARLTQGQRQIARAVSEGRVRFEVVRVFEDGTIKSHTWYPKNR